LTTAVIVASTILVPA
jgi:FtsH-binding integral membrane protein